MSQQPERVRRTTDLLDAAGNVTKVSFFIFLVNKLILTQYTQ